MSEVQTNEITVRAIQTRRLEPGFSTIYEEGTLITAKSGDKILMNTFVREYSHSPYSYHSRVAKEVKRTLKIARQIKNNQGVLVQRKLHPWWKFWSRK